MATLPGWVPSLQDPCLAVTLWLAGGSGAGLLMMGLACVWPAGLWAREAGVAS